MASGTWSETDRPIRSGFYNRFKAAALARIQMGKRGIVAMPVKANWGPAKEVVSITSEPSLINNYGSDPNYTAYRLGRLALLGQPKELLLYRLTDGSEKVAEVTLKNTSDANALKLETKYPSTRDFKVTVRPSIVNEEAKDIVLHEGTRLLYTFTGLIGTMDEVVEAINGNEDNKWLKATKVANGPLADVVTQALTGGNDGTAGVTNEDYINAMDKFEGYKFNGFTLDGVTDPALHTSVRSWVKRNRRNGKKIRAYVGGELNESINDANNRSKAHNYEGFHNIGSTGGVLDGVTYTPAEVAVYVCALGEGQDMRASLCNQVTIFNDVTTHLSDEEITSSILSGTMVLRYDDGAVVIEDDVNTLKRYGEDQNETWGFLRAIKFMDMVDEDTSFTGNRQYVGKVLNGETGQIALLTALKLYFETLQIGQLIEDFKVEIDEDLQKNAANDEFFWIWDAKYINVMKKIMGTGYIR